MNPQVLNYLLTKLRMEGNNLSNLSDGLNNRNLNEAKIDLKMSANLLFTIAKMIENQHSQLTQKTTEK
jgi:hypothetical protein